MSQLEKLYEQYLELERQADEIADKMISFAKVYHIYDERNGEKLSHNAHVRDDILLPDMVKLLVQKELQREKRREEEEKEKEKEKENNN